MAIGKITTEDFKGEHLSVSMAGAKGDTQVTTVSTIFNSPVVTRVGLGPDFSPADVGKSIAIYGADSASGLETFLGAANTAGNLMDSFSVVLSFDSLGVASKIGLAVNCTFQDATWQVYGANLSDYSDEISLTGPTNVVSQDPSLSLVQTPPTKRYYRIRAKNKTAGQISLCYFTITIWGYVLGTTISGFISPTQINVASAPQQTISAIGAIYGSDDTVAIQEAIDFANSLVTAGTADGGAEIFLPPGRYFISAPIFHKKCVIVKGSSSGSTIIYLHPKSFPTNTVAWNMTGTLQSNGQLAFFTRLENIRLDCQHVPGSIGVFCDALQENSGLYHCTIIQWTKYGIQAGSVADPFGCNNWIVQDANVYPSPTAFLDSTVRGFIGNFAINTTIIRGTFFSQGGFIGGYGTAIDFSNGFITLLGQIHIECANIGIHFNTGSGGYVSGVVDTQSFVTVAIQIDAGNPVIIGHVSHSGKTTLIDNIQANTISGSNFPQISGYICNPVHLSHLMGSSLQFTQSNPSGGPNIITIDPINFGTDQQGGFLAVNSKPVGFPNWTQTSGSVAYTKGMFMRLAAAAFEIMIGAATNSNGTNPGTSYLYCDDLIGGIRTPRLYFDAPGVNGPLGFGNNLDVNRSRWFHGGVGQGNLKLQRSTDSGATWNDVIKIDLTTGIVTQISGYEIDTGYGTSPSQPNDLFIGAGGVAPLAASLAFGDGSGYKLNFIAKVSGSPTIFATLTDNGQFATGWLGAGITTPSSGSSTLDALESQISKLGVGGTPGGGSTLLKVYGDSEITGVVKNDSLTASRPVITDASKNLISVKIDLSSANLVQGSGLASGQALTWNGTNVVGVAGLASGTVSEIPGGSPSPLTVVTNVTFGGTAPPGLTLVVTTDTASKDFTVNQHTIVEGIVQ